MSELKPTQSILVVGVQRSGTSFLCDAIKSIGLAGIPGEYFLQIAEPQWIEDKGITDIRSYIDEAIASGMSENGVFGAKIMWNTFGEFLKRAQKLPELSSMQKGEIIEALFGNAAYVWLRRRDKISQAVSWAKAAQTGIFTSLQSPNNEKANLPQYDFDLIDNLHRLILEGEAGWGSYFDAIGARPNKVFYEDLLSDLDGTLNSVMLACGVTKSRPINASEIEFKKQANATNYEWVARYKIEKGC